jgi:hypothetical protein
MTDVIIVVIALTVALAVELLPVLQARRRPKRNGDERRPA